jgi:cytochrome P450
LGLPFLGETGSFLKDPFRFFEERFRAHGPVFKTRILGDTVACFVGPEAFSFFVNEEFFTRADASPPHFQELLHPEALPFIDGPRHKNRRKLLMNAFTRDALLGYVPIFQGIIERYLTRWEDGVERAGVDEIGSMAFAIADSLFAGGDPQKDNPAMAKIFDQVMAGVFAIPLKLPFSTFSKALSARDQLRAYISGVVDGYRPGTGSHVLERLVSARDENGAGLPKDELKIELLHFYFAAYGGLQAALVDLLMALAENPEVERRARQEVARVTPSGPLGDALDRLPYVQQVGQEVRRYYAMIPSTFFAKVKRDCEFRGMTIQKGWKAVAALHSTMRDETTFANPTQFDPDRFSPERAEDGKKPNSFVPHGGGPMTGHRCAGEALANQLIKAFTAIALRNHSWTLPQQDLSFKVGGLAPLPADRLRITFRKGQP